MFYQKVASIVGTICVLAGPALSQESGALRPSAANSSVNSFSETVARITTESEAQTLEKLARANELISKEPRNAKYLAARGQLYKNLGRNAEAMRDLTAAIDINPRFQKYYEVRGTLWGSLEKYQNALADFEMALKVGVPSALLLVAKASALSQLGRPNDSLATLSEAIRLEPTSDVAWGSRAELRLEQHDVIGASADCAKAQQLKPGEKEWQDLRAEIMKRQ